MGIWEKTAGGDTFEEAIKGRKFRNPETGNDVVFGSLPAKEQAKLREEWASKNDGKSKDKDIKEPKNKFSDVFLDEDSGAEQPKSIFTPKIDEEAFDEFSHDLRQSLKGNALLKDLDYDIQDDFVSFFPKEDREYTTEEFDQWKKDTHPKVKKLIADVLSKIQTPEGRTKYVS